MQQSCSGRNQLLACLHLHHPEAHQHCSSLWSFPHGDSEWLPPPQRPEHLLVSSCGQSEGPSLQWTDLDSHCSPPVWCHPEGRGPRSSPVQPSRCTAPSRSSRSRRGAAPTGAWCLGLQGEPSVPQVPEPLSLGVSATTGSRADQHRVPLPMEDQLKVMDSLYLHQTKFNTLSTIHFSIYHTLITIPFPIAQ